MKKMFGILSLFAILALSFTVQAADVFDDVGIVSIYCENDLLTADVVFAAAPINSSVEFAMQGEFEDFSTKNFLPVEVGLIRGILNNFSLSKFSATFLLPVEVGLQSQNLSYNLTYSSSLSRSLSQGYFVANRYSDAHEPVGWLATTSKK